jgi:putative transcriptional regulator
MNCQKKSCRKLLQQHITFQFIYGWLLGISATGPNWKTIHLLEQGYLEWQSSFAFAGSFIKYGERKMYNRIKELRARFNLTQDDLANKVGVRRETIVFLEKGKYNPSLKLAHDISSVFNCSIEDVFLFEEKADGSL